MTSHERSEPSSSDTKYGGQASNVALRTSMNSFCSRFVSLIFEQELIFFMYLASLHKALSLRAARTVTACFDSFKAQ